MYKLKKVYICDHCGKVALPDFVGPYGDKVMPLDWNCLGKEHICDRCSAVYKRFLDEVSPPHNIK